MATSFRFAAEVMHWSGQHGARVSTPSGISPRRPGLRRPGCSGDHLESGDGFFFFFLFLFFRRKRCPARPLAIDRFPNDLLINRGVLLDVARLVQGDSSPLPATFEITAKHLRDAARHQHVQLRKGDTVFIRTGWGPYFAAHPDIYAGANSPGPGLDAAEFLISSGARIVGDDTLTFEQRPPITLTPKFQVFPVHMRLIADSGIFIIENLNLRSCPPYAPTNSRLSRLRLKCEGERDLRCARSPRRARTLSARRVT